MSNARVCILHVGGTIGMVETPEGLAPQSGLLERYLGAMPEMQRPEMPNYELHVLEPLLDSADMTPRDWVRIAQAIVERDRDFDGFVVLHGTDTMVHSASALSFLLPGLRKPVVLTGAQLSLTHPRTDGREHIITSLMIAGELDIPEVCIYFADRLLRGNRAQKIDNQTFQAFSSGNLPPLATVGTRIDVAQHLIRRPGEGLPTQVSLSREPHVFALRVFPGITRAVLASALSPGIDGLILETYGAGTFPSRDERMLATVEAATSRKPPTLVVNCSQCHGGVVRQHFYKSSRLLADAGVISGYDMTPEAALTKLYVLLATGLPPSTVREKMTVDLAGELDHKAVTEE
jgi:L-asparaginase